MQILNHTIVFFLLSIFQLSGCNHATLDPGKKGNTDNISEVETDSESDTDPRLDTGVPGHQVFEQTALLEYRITMDESDREQLEEFGDNEIYLPASLTVIGGEINETFNAVGFRHKGSWTLHHCYEEGYRSYDDDCAKISYKVKFSEYDEKARLFGLKRINLHAMSGDETKLRERLAYDLYNSFGVVAPRTAYAELFINDESMGLFVQVEQIDGRFTAYHFPNDGNGNLYKEVWPRPGLSESHYISHLETNNQPEDEPDVSDIAAFGEAIGTCTADNFEEVVSNWVDLDNLLRYVAVDRAVNNWDGIMTFYSPYSGHNFYWYHEAENTGIFHLIPWDLDNTFWEFDPVVHPEQWVTADPVPNWNVLPASCDPVPIWDPANETRVTPPGCDPLIHLLAQTQWDRFADVGEALLGGPFQASVMEEKLSKWETEIDEIAKEDPFMDYEEWKKAAAEFRAVIARNIVDFQDHIEEGYRIQEPPVVISEPEDDVLNGEIEESGLLVDIINNYEFKGGASDTAPKEISVQTNSQTTATPTWNTADPLSGTADFRLDFEIPRVAGAWNEWIDASVITDEYQEFDLTELEEISITMKSDRLRTVRVKISSPVYNTDFGGVWPNFMVEFAVGTEPQIFKLKLDRLYYPSWAKDAWTGDDGWTTSDTDALDRILARFQGIIISPQPITDSEGELAEEVETGFIQVDNIYFR